jgi:2-dehydro-3-deoxyglucarate aldolase/4-hydroxy-2-oxoheptanedioate aldolase
MNTAPSFRLGTWLSIGSPVVAELAALCGFDWVLIDLEHGCASEATVPDQLRAMRGSSTRAVVRVGAPHPDLIARVLDWGAHGIMVPRVESAEQAAEIVTAAHYAPRGKRGFSRTVRAYDYGLRPPEEVGSLAPLIMAQIESLEGVRNAASIAAVDGIDVLFIGPADLSFDLQQRPTAGIGSYDACVAQVLEAARIEAKTTGILLRDANAVATHAAQGFTYLAVESDLSILRKAYQEILKRQASGG